MMVAKRNMALVLLLSAIVFMLLALLPPGPIFGLGAAPLAFPAFVMSIFSLLMLVIWMLRA